MQKIKSILSASLLAASFVMCTFAVAQPAEAMRPVVTACVNTSANECTVSTNGGTNTYKGEFKDIIL